MCIEYTPTRVGERCVLEKTGLGEGIHNGVYTFPNILQISSRVEEVFADFSVLMSVAGREGPCPACHKKPGTKQPVNFARPS